MTAPLKVHISPGPGQVSGDNGIGRVVLAQYKYLPDHGIELVDSPDAADVIAAHIQQGDLPRVDVLMVHGLYWTGDPGSGRYVAMHHEANSRIIDAARRAQIVTVPSAWVGECFKRDMRINPTVIGHGINLDALPERGPDKGYVLWNKNRAGDVCSPAAANALARRGVDVVSTFGDPGPHMRLIGSVKHDAMMDVLRHAHVYLATTKETFGIGTLEALALGVPVLGYDWGGTAELLKYGGGELVQPGDIEGLIAGLAMINADYDGYSEMARIRARDHEWAHAMVQYAAVYHEAYRLRQQEQARSGVSVVITNYNYLDYVGGAIESAVLQSAPPAELIVVDDGSTDGSNAEIERIFDGVRHDFPAIALRHIRQANQGVASARNNGIAAATQEYIICLDADDELAHDYVKVCHRAMLGDRSLGIAYTGMAWLTDEGSSGQNIWRQAFDWERQATPANPPATTIPTAAMFRKTMWERAGGYQQIYAPGEDAEFYTRGLSVGFTAKQVTDAPLMLYRNTPGSASKVKQYRPIDTWHPWMRDKQYPMGAPARVQPLVRSYSEPIISVIIPVGLGHVRYLPSALDSLLGQTFRNWEVICVVDFSIADYRESWYQLHERYPFIAWKYSNGMYGPGAARNIGLRDARAPLCLFLDADDYLTPDALQTMLDAYMAGGAGYVYSDWYGRGADGAMKVQRMPEYRQDEYLKPHVSAITVLMATADARKVGGFDEALRGWEDWDFFIKCAVNGICGRHVAAPLLVYNLETGTMRVAAQANKDTIQAALMDRYATYASGEKTIMGCCGGNGDATMRIKQILSGAEPDAPMAGQGAENVVRMEYIGPKVAAVTFYGVQASRQYRGGNNPLEKYHNVDPRDVAHLVSTGEWAVVQGWNPAPAPAVVNVAALLSAPAPEGPMLDAAPALTPPDADDGITPEQEAEMNRAAIEMLRKERKAS